MVMDILLTICKGWESPETEARHPISDYTLMNRVIDMVFSSTGMVTVQAAAQACGLNRNSFSNWFRLSTGISFPKFALRYRLSSAAHLLRRTDEPVKVIARKWGFAHVSHMHKSFIEHYGVSPAAYRKSGS
jgi:AraC-like DNA-binding protein